MKPISDKMLLKLWGSAVIERAGHHCQYPDCNVNYTQVHPHHIFTRRCVTMRYNLDNGIALCATHHTMGADSAHLSPDFKDVLISCGVRSAEFFDKLRREKNRVQKNNQAWKNECYEKVKLYLNC